MLRLMMRRLRGSVVVHHAMLLGLGLPRMAVHMMTLMMVMIDVHLWRTLWPADPVAHCRLELARGVHYGCLVPVLWHVPHGAGTVRPVVHALVVSRRSDVHPVVGRKPRVRYALRGLPRHRGPSVVVRWYALSGIATGVFAHHSAVVMLRVWMFRGDHTTIPQVWHVRVGKI